jgi:cell division protein FtsW (lipid II flippase)
MQYFAGLVVFLGIGSFLISDTINFGSELKKSNSPHRLYLDFFRLLGLGGMALIGYMVAQETFRQPNDWIVFLVVGVIGAFLIYALGVKRRTADAKRCQRTR